MGHDNLVHDQTKIAMENEKDRNKIREPYTPEGTPNPPQIIDPSYKEEQRDKSTSASNKQQPGDKREPTAGDKKEKKKILGESETEINDETTI